MSTTTDPIADMLTRLRNGLNSNKDEVRMPYSRLKEAVVRVIADQGFLAKVEVATEDDRKYLIVKLMDVTGHPSMSHLKRLSSPGRRLYVPADKIPTVRRGRGIVVVSTSAGLMAGHQAKTKRLGGELICEVY